MNLLRLTRGHLKGSITRAHSFILDNSDSDIDGLQTRLDRLEETWKEFCLNHNKMFEYCDEEGYVDPESDFEAIENKYLDTKCAFMKAIRDKSNSQLLSSPPCAHDSVESSQSLEKTKSCVEIELPKFKIPPFGGDYREWPQFRDMFLGSIDCKRNLSGTQKLRYLISFLENDAAKLLHGIEIADPNYEEAWNKLERRYDKPLYITNAHIDSFLKLPSVSVADGGRRLTDKSDEVIRGLKALKVVTLG